MNVSCPHCRREYTLDDSQAGKSCRCGYCKNVFTAIDHSPEPEPEPEVIPVASAPLGAVVVEGEMESTAGRAEPSWSASRTEDAPRVSRDDDGATPTIKSAAWPQDRYKPAPPLSTGFLVFVVLILVLAGILMAGLIIVGNPQMRMQNGDIPNGQRQVELNQRLLFEEWEKETQELNRLQNLPGGNAQELEDARKRVRDIERRSRNQWGQNPNSFRHLPESDDPYYNEF